MIALPPGCTVTYAVYVDVDRLTEEMIEWYKLVGGNIYLDKWYNHRGQEKTLTFVSYGRGKRCHHHNNGGGEGSGGTRLHFLGEDASAASMFIMKFFEHITRNNLTDVMERQAREAV